MSLKEFTGSREQVITEGEFLPIVEVAASHLLELRVIVRTGAGKEWSRRFVSVLIREVHGLRTVLNDYDAQENSTYSYFTELVAGIRTFSKVVYVLKHLRERFLRSHLAENGEESRRFFRETNEALSFCGNKLRALFDVFTVECEELGVELPEPLTVEDVERARDSEFRKHLPHNIDEEEMQGEDAKIAQVASSFLRAAELYETMAPPMELETYLELKRFVQERLDEERARQIESRIHAIQSKYDTYIQYTASESRNPELRKIRFVISLALHLFEATTHLIHFYERHENDIRSESVKQRVSGTVNKRAVLDSAVNYAFRSAGWLMAEGKETALKLIPEYTSIREVTFQIPHDVRLHIRPAALIASIVTHHGTPVRMKMGDGECDASSVTDVIFLAGTNLDAREVTFHGDERPLADLHELFDIGLRDEGREELEERLSYLKQG
ncbi:MAG: HPr family phosphocarrier protein [Planctomycetota bacterium]